MTGTPHPSSRRASSAVVIAATGAASLDHELDPRRRVRRIDRHIRRPGLEHRQDRHDRLRRPRQQQRHRHDRDRTTLDQHMRQPVRRLVELAVGHRPTRTAHRHRIRGRATCAANSPGIDTPRHRPRQHRTVAQLVERATCSRASSTSIDDSRVAGIGRHGHQHPLQPFDQRRRSRPASNTSVSYSTRRRSSSPGGASTVSG